VERFLSFVKGAGVLVLAVVAVLVIVPSVVFIGFSLFNFN
jgi:hypothetical protein